MFRRVLVFDQLMYDYPYKKINFGDCMAKDPRMQGECEQSLKISANARRVFAETIALTYSFLLEQSPKELVIWHSSLNIRRKT